MQLAQFLACVPLNAVALYKTLMRYTKMDLRKLIGIKIGDDHDQGMIGGILGILDGGCDTTLTLVLIQQWLYTTYFFLFAHFFYQAYLTKGRGGEKSKRLKEE